MISIELLTSDDPEALGKYHFGFDEISIGYALKNDVVIRAKEWQRKQIDLKITADGLKVKANDNIDYFLSNDKKISGAKVHQKDDIIQIENTKIKILDFSSSVPEAPNFVELYKKRAEENPELIPLMDSITKELREQE